MKVNKYLKIIKKYLPNKKQLLLLFLGVAILSFSWLAWISLTLPDYQQISSRRVSESTKIYDRTGKVLLYEIHNGENRTVLSFEEIPEVVKQATIAAEDKNFYTHPAFDWRGITRSIFINLTSNQRVSGSTITQQLAKNAFLTQEKTLIRKIKELLIAFKLENNFTKDEILTLYLNQIPYGGSIYGIEEAAQAYFGKPAKDLTLAEASVLAALPQAPTYYSPYNKNKEQLFNRQKYVLNQMLEAGFISESDKNQALEEELVFKPQSNLIKAPHFVMMVVDYLQKVYGEEMLQTGGLRVITTLDYDLQEKAEEAVRNGVERNTRLYSGTNGALVAEEAKTGEVVALVGAADYFDVDNEGNFNVAAQGLRQPGSAFKPFAYLEAFNKGYTPETILFDVPTEFSSASSICPVEVDFNNNNTRCYHPKNFDHEFRGPVSMRNALAQSINVPAVKTLYLAGLDNTIKTAEKLGITTLQDRSRFGLSLVLGGGEVTLTELVGAYGVFANDGIKSEQHIIRKVEDSRGKVLEEWQDKNSQVNEVEPIRELNSVLSDVTARSGLFHSSLNLTVFPGRQVALKTGTTNDYVDAWTVGYTPSLVVGVWAGNNHREPMQQQGSSLLAALPMWSEFFNQAIENYPIETFNKPNQEQPEKPILRGNFTFNNQIHSILWYVDKDRPTEAKPSHPESDPQYNNWEIPVINWARNNLSNFANFNQNNDYNYQSNQLLEPIEITINNPQPGDFIKGEERGEVQIKSNSLIKEVEIKLNKTTLKKVSEINRDQVQIEFSLREVELQPQNTLEIVASNESGNSVSQKIIIYR